MTKNEIYETVKKAILEVLPDVDQNLVTIEKSLKELGANSVDRMEVVTMSMEKLALKIPLLSFAKVSNIESLVDVLTEKYHSHSNN